MTAVSEDVTADLNLRIAELERRLEAALIERDTAIERQTASALVNFRLQNEVRAATERQKAGAEILRSIAASAGDAGNALQKIAETTLHFFNAASVTIRIAEGDEWVQTVRVGSSSHLTGAQPASQLATRGANLPATVYQDNRQIHIPDLDHIDPSMADWPATAAREAGIRTICGTPLRRNGTAIGALLVYRDRLAAFTAEELALQQSFADQAVIAIENARLFNETQRALERQSASAEILRTIASTPGESEQSLRQIAETTAHFFGASSVTIRIAENGEWTRVINVGEGSNRISAAVPAGLLTIEGENMPGVVFRENRQVHIPDLDNPDPAIAAWPGIKPARSAGTRVLSGTPLRRGSQAIGALVIHRDRLVPFTLDELALQQSFADQAVIAIENARLFNETREALERQTATAEILKVIAGSPSDVQPVFDAIASSANRLISGFSTAVLRIIDDVVHLVAFTPTDPESDEALKAAFPRHRSEMSPVASIQDGQTAQIADAETADEQTKRLGRARGWRSITFTPLMNQGTFIGYITCTRRETGVLADHHVELLRTFADQAVIAIENTRLFNEVRAKTRDLEETLQQQTATADVLKVISRSVFDLQTVLDTLVESAYQLCGARQGLLYLRGEEAFECKAIAGRGSAEASRQFKGRPIRAGRGTAAERVILTGEVHCVENLLEDPEVDPAVKDMIRNAGPDAAISGARSTLAVPMTRDNTVVGVMVIVREETGPFPARQVELLQTFADQAVIAIENARLITETQEALERQSAMSDVLRVINGSAGDLTPVFNAILEKAHHLCGAPCGSLQLYQDDHVVPVAIRGMTDAFTEFLRAGYPITEGVRAGLFASHPRQIPDLAEAIRGQPDEPSLTTAVELGGIRTMATVPLARDGVTFGRIVAGRREVRPFTDKQIAVLQGFADQAVIAIENARLFNETQEALERQTATADILKVIASSPSDVQPVFDVIAERSNSIIAGLSTSVLGVVDDMLHLRALTPVNPEADAALEAFYPQPLSAYTFFDDVGQGRVGRVIDSEVDMERPEALKMSRLRGWRSALLVPLLRQGKVIGAISVTRAEPGTFADHHVQLLQTFADQAVIAIENVRLFNETQEALERQTATAEILKVIASSPSDVQPVFDAIAERSNRLMGGHSTAAYRFTDQTIELVSFTPVSPEADAMLQAAFPRPLSEHPMFELVREGHTRQFYDVEAEAAAFTKATTMVRDVARARRFRSVLLTPLLGENGSIGLISVSRKEPSVFSEHHVKLLHTFADQAVIAIQNTHLFNETQEALERQTATAEILKVIASSPSDVQPVFEAIAHSANRLIGGFSTAVYRVIDDIVDMVAFTPTNPDSDAALKAAFPMHRNEVPAVALVQSGETAQIGDSELADAQTQRLGRARGWRSVTFTPLMNQSAFIGFIVCTRRETGVLAEHHVQLLRTFADQAVIAIQNTRLFNETQEALERQTATADILKVIASSPSDVQPVFDAIAASANRLLGGFSSTVFRLIDGMAHLKAFTPVNPEADEALTSTFPAPVTQFAPIRVMQSGEVLQIADTEAAEYELKEIARARGYRSMIWTPLMNMGESIGFIAVTRVQPGSFVDHHVQLLKTFADQAVIAIENTRLFNETREALERQTATSDILRVIAGSPSDVHPVFEAILARSLHLCEAAFGFLTTYDGERFDFAAQLGVPPALAEHFRAGMDQPQPGDAHWRLKEGEELIHNMDQKDEDAYRAGNPLRRAVVDIGGARSALVVALRKGGSLRGSITIYRKEVRPFSESQIALLRHFADQAVIAIENTRLFNEVQARTLELSEALEQQTATSEVLSVISSSAGDLAPVFDTMLGKAMQLCSANFGVLNTYDGKAFHTEATYGLPPAYDEYRRRQPQIYGPGTAPARLLQGVPVVQSTDLRESEAYVNGEPNRRALVDIGGAQCLLAVPLLKDEHVVGLVMIFRQENRPFSDKQIALLQQFAAQAVIAIENTRLLRELRESTEDLSESLQQQTATSEVLQVISSSPGDLAPVFDKMLENATRVCGAEFGSMNLIEGDMMRRAALYNAPPAFAATLSGKLFQVHPGSSILTAVRSKQVVQVEDLRDSASYLARAQHAVELAELGGARTLVIVPMLKEQETIGVITVYRREVHLFGDKQIELLRNFARQAVIAIENARLLRELRQRTDDLSEALVYQTGSSNILKVIASSPTDVGPALKAIVDSACEICDAYDAAVMLKDGDELVLSAHHGPIPFALGRRPLDRRMVTGRAVLDKAPQHIHDLLGPEGDEFPEGKEVARRQGHRTILAVPLLREGESIGTIILRRTEVQPFNDKQIELLKSFADQAVIAISNVRLFEEVQQRTRELSKSLDDLRTAQDRLIQTEKLASLGQLTAGIAHEIKNPLNFVNNFAALSAELTDELKDSLKPAVLDETIRAEVDEITGMLKDNLGKVVQHGKRADSIVKNMLLHSREGSGEHRPVDINALVEESLNLAYHGARAEKPQFNVTLKRDFDPAAGTVEAFPQEITRVLLNLVSNGFYAVAKRKAADGADYEPKVTATTLSRDDHVEIRIRDNGTGIPPEVKEKMFNPFFTTKPAGEGTGLGLSMSHDIIVKQHGGSIEVETEPGAFTEFRLVLPRASLSRTNGNR